MIKEYNWKNTLSNGTVFHHRLLKLRIPFFNLYLAYRWDWLIDKNGICLDCANSIEIIEDL